MFETTKVVTRKQQRITIMSKVEEFTRFIVLCDSMKTNVNICM